MTKRVRNRIDYGINDDSSDMRKFIIILSIIVLIAGIIYYVTEKIKNSSIEEKTSATGIVDYDKLS